MAREELGCDHAAADAAAKLEHIEPGAQGLGALAADGVGAESDGGVGEVGGEVVEVARGQPHVGVGDDEDFAFGDGRHADELGHLGVDGGCWVGEDEPDPIGVKRPHALGDGVGSVTLGGDAEDEFIRRPERSDGHFEEKFGVVVKAGEGAEDGDRRPRVRNGGRGPLPPGEEHHDLAAQEEGARRSEEREQHLRRLHDRRKHGEVNRGEESQEVHRRLRIRDAAGYQRPRRRQPLPNSVPEKGDCGARRPPDCRQWLRETRSCHSPV